MNIEPIGKHTSMRGHTYQLFSEAPAGLVPVFNWESVHPRVSHPIAMLANQDDVKHLMGRTPLVVPDDLLDWIPLSALLESAKPIAIERKPLPRILRVRPKAKDTDPKSPYKTLKAAREAGFRKYCDRMYGGEVYRIGGQLMARGFRYASSKTMWKSLGYEVQEGAKPHSYGYSPKCGKYAEYREDQVNPVTRKAKVKAKVKAR